MLPMGNIISLLPILLFVVVGLAFKVHEPRPDFPRTSSSHSWTAFQAGWCSAHVQLCGKE